MKTSLDAALPSASPAPLVNLSRRHFLGSSAALVLGVSLPAASASMRQSYYPNLFIGLHTSGAVFVTVHRSEMGQGVRTALVQIIADELEADWSQVRVRQAPGDAKYGDQNTDGSRSILQNYDRLRTAGATVRLMLRQAAAARWQVPVEDVQAVNHEVVHAGSGRRLGYGALVAEAAALPIPPNAPLKTTAEHRFIGKAVTHVDAADIARGKAEFGADERLPNMATAVVVRCPWLGGGVKRIVNKPDEAPGLVAIEILDPAPSAGPVFTPLGGVAVVAEDTFTALRIARGLNIEWTDSPNRAFDSDALRMALREALARPGAKVPGAERGDVDAAFLAGKGTTLSATYETPFLAHAPMEPPVALAEVAFARRGVSRLAKKRCFVSAPLQDPQSARDLIAERLGLPLEDVTVWPTLLGGAFGRKSKPDFALEAVELSNRIGRPVRVQWSREDDIRHDYLHAASAQLHRAIIDEDGLPRAWLQRTAFPSITTVFSPQASAPAPWELEMGFSNLPYQVPNRRMESAGIRAGARIGWLRSVCNIFHAFSANVFADEMAAAAGRDPIEHRLDMLPKNGKLAVPGMQPPPGHELDVARFRHVIERVRALSDWDRPRPEGTGIGFAVHHSFRSYVATVLEASVVGGRPKVSNAYMVLDCGTYVNADTCKAQMEGAVVFGLSLALHGEIAMREGAVVQSNFHDYPMLRMADAPATAVELVPAQGRLPAGVGEPGVPPVAPALVNALFAATGERHRSLPIRV